jgi:hypothetical protein
MQLRLVGFIGLVAYCCAAADRKPADEILSFAASEPLLLSMDTRLRLAKALVKSDLKTALEVARDTAGLLGTLPDPDTRGELCMRLTTILLATDPREAERFVMTMEPRRYRDTKAEALDLVVRYWRERDEKRALQVLADGIGAGAFRVESLRDVIERLRTADPPAVPALFAILLSGFPQDGATDRECLFLLERAAQVVSIDSALAVEAAQRVLRAIDSKSFVEDPDWRFQLRYAEGDTKFEKEGARAAIRVQAEGFIQAAQGRIKLEEAIAMAAGENLVAYPRHEILADEPFLVDVFASATTSERELKRLQGEEPEPIYTELERARALEEASERAPRLTDIAMRPDATPPQRAQIAAEAIDALAEMPWLSGREVLLERLLADARERDNRSLAARAAASLAGTLAAMCADLKGRKQCIEAYDREAKFFLREKIEPAEFGVGDPSLLARILILKQF